MIICNTTPLIALASIDSLKLLDALTEDWCVPEAVYKEAIVKDKPYSDVLLKFLKGKIQKVTDMDAVKNLNIFIDSGEAEVIQLASELDAPLVIIDERRGRNIAKLKGLTVIGTVGLLLKAKERGLIEAILPLVQEMKSKNIHLSKELIEKIKELSGEI